MVTLILICTFSDVPDIFSTGKCFLLVQTLTLVLDASDVSTTCTMKFEMAVKMQGHVFTIPVVLQDYHAGYRFILYISQNASQIHIPKGFGDRLNHKMSHDVLLLKVTLITRKV